MRKETQEIMNAFVLGQSKHKARTSTDGNAVYLHGNMIVERVMYEQGGLKGYRCTLAGWPTVTTRERLNGFLNTIGAYRAGFSQRDHKQYFTDLTEEEREIEDDEWIFIKA